jgi:hypothetical protein
VFWRGVFGQLILAALLFGSAGSVRFWQGWAFLGVSAVATTFGCIYFYKHDPQLLERRMLRKENMGAQKLFMVLWKALGATSFLLAGYDHRVGWSRMALASVPVWLELLSLSAIVAGHVLFFYVMKANSFAASVIRVEACQTVITGALSVGSPSDVLGIRGHDPVYSAGTGFVSRVAGGCAHPRDYNVASASRGNNSAPRPARLC